MTRPLFTKAEHETQVRSGLCYEAGCQKPPAWIVSTMGGPLAFCEAHAQWYRQRDPSIYPVEKYPA